MCCHLENKLEEVNAKYQRLADQYGKQQYIIEKLIKGGYKERAGHTTITYQLKRIEEV